MDLHLRIVSSILSLLALICLTMLFKRGGVIDEQHGPLFSKLITQVTLPALIFVSLTRTELVWSEFELALIMLGVSLICLALGWGVARALRLDDARTGAVILVTGFGSSSLLGFALISEVFPGDDQTMAEAAMLSGLGVQPALFTLGTMIAMSFGHQTNEPGARLRAALRYLHSPIFIALVSGLILSALLQGRSDPILSSIQDGLHIVGGANTFLVILTVGLTLQLSGLRDVTRIGASVCAVKLLIMPVLLWLPSHAMSLPDWQMQVLVLEGAMPSAMLSVVLCNAYGCDARLASKLVLMTTVLSVFTVPVLFQILA